MKTKFFSFVLLILCSGCMHEVFNPFGLAPTSPYATWSPVEGNRLVSAKYCQTVLPNEFAQEALSLAELLDIGLQNNPTTKQTWAQARAAAASYGQSLSPYFPNIQFAGVYMRQRFSAFQVIGEGPVTMSYLT